MRKKQPTKKCEAIVIAHGKAEELLAGEIKKRLRLPIEINPKNPNFSKKLAGLRPFLDENIIYRNKEKFKSSFPDYNFEIKKGKLENCKIFIIMDMDDCVHDGRPELAGQFKDKSMFKGHWLYDNIVPIYNDLNLETVAKKAGWDIEHDLGTYRKFFENIPNNKRVEFWQESSEKFKRDPNTNLNIFIDYCMEWAERTNPK